MGINSITLYGISKAQNLLMSEDVIATLKAIKTLGDKSLLQ